jgi:hypothetical protein
MISSRKRLLRRLSVKHAQANKKNIAKISLAMGKRQDYPQRGGACTHVVDTFIYRGSNMSSYSDSEHNTCDFFIPKTCTQSSSDALSMWCLLSPM